MRWIVRVGVALAILVLLAFGLLAIVPSDRIAQVVSTQFEAMTGRKLEVAGEIRPRLWPSLGVTTGPVSIANAEWAESDQPLFRAENLSVDVNLGALLGGEVKILGLAADRPEINLERSRDGKANWDFAAGLPSDGTGVGAVPPPATGFTLDEGAIRGGTIRFDDRQSGRRIALDEVDARLSIPDFSGPFRLAATALSGGQKVALDLSGDVFSAFAMGRVVPIKVSLTAGGSKLGFEGRGGYAPLAAEGALVADLPDLPALGRLFGASLSRPSPGLGHDRLQASGQLTLDGSGRAFLRQATLAADANELKGDLDLTPGEARPKLKAQLTAGPISLNTGSAGGTGGGAGGGAGGGMQAEGWPEDVIDVSALGVMDAEVALTAPSVDLGVLKLGPTRALITVERSRAVFDFREAQAYGGRITGDFVVNGRGGLSVGGRLNLAGLQTQPLFADLVGWDRLVSTGDLELEFLGVGNSIAAIMKSLKGKGAITLGKGELRGLDIAGMLRTLDAGYVGEGQKTIFDGLAGTFAMEGGVLTNSDLKLVAPYLTAAGAGRIGLGERTLDYRLRPTALAAADGTGGVMVPLLITGPWAKPRFRLDLESIAREKMEAEAKAAAERLKAEAKAAEAAAKAELERRLKEELGVEVAPDDSLGAAAKRRATKALEDEARRALEEILGGN
ncbi:AsmA family protein [Rhodobacter calidifons]|uniref:AsmA family protein n=1 Tax=Rhodobacter calidifons TaxID=2715277 RepID=A0ABX0G3U1_9RHOB|nr:AsmA family protein [Rhodobacter calidifons]NHB75524.1 AsmA family protein [Rhodobacter calidifons]